MITKLTGSPLDNFSAIAPTQGRVPSDYILSVGRQRIHMNKTCFKHFKGHHYFKFMIHSHYLAVVATSKDDPNAVRLNARRSKSHVEYSYNSLFNKGIHARILKRLPKRPTHKSIRLTVDKDRMSPKYLIFDLQNVKN